MNPPMQAIRGIIYKNLIMLSALEIQKGDADNFYLHAESSSVYFVASVNSYILLL